MTRTMNAVVNSIEGVVLRKNAYVCVGGGRRDAKHYCMGQPTYDLV